MSFSQNVIAFLEEDAVPEAVIAIQSFGAFLGFNPHCYVLCTDGCFYGDDGQAKKILKHIGLWDAKSQKF